MTDNGKQVTAAQLSRVQDRLRRLYVDESITPSELARRSGIPQPTLSAIVNANKLGTATVRKLANYFDETPDELLNGTHSAGYYALREEGLGVGYPKRGKVLDGLRHCFPAEVLDEVQAVVLPQGEREWTEADWAMEVAVTAKRWQRLRNPPEDPSNGPPNTHGHPRKARM